MDDAEFDRLARALSTILTRRRAMAIFGIAAGVMSQRAALGAQLSPATCGEEGAVCTLVSGCCDGLTCVTSAINTSYGICVPGEGGMVSTGTTLISPFSETAVEEVSALMENAAAEPTTDPRADRQARIAEIRGRRAAKRSGSTTGLTTGRSTTRIPGVKTPRPRLKLELTTSTRDDPKTDEDTKVQVDTVKATNGGDTSLILTGIASLLALEDGQSLTTNSSTFTLDPGDDYFFLAGLSTADATEERYDWTTKAACDGSPGAGYLVKAALTVDSENKDFEILCDRASGTAAAESASKPSRGKRKRNNQQRNKQQQKKKKR
jgi:hypothetical protein